MSGRRAPTLSPDGPGLIESYRRWWPSSFTRLPTFPTGWPVNINRRALSSASGVHPNRAPPARLPGQSGKAIKLVAWVDRRTSCQDAPPPVKRWRTICGWHGPSGGSKLEVANRDGRDDSALAEDVAALGGRLFDGVPIALGYFEAALQRAPARCQQHRRPLVKVVARRPWAALERPAGVRLMS